MTRRRSLKTLILRIQVTLQLMLSRSQNWFGYLHHVVVTDDAVSSWFVVHRRGKLFTGDPGWSQETVPKSKGNRFVGKCRGLVSSGSGAQAASFAMVNCSKCASVGCGVLSMLIPLGNLGTWDVRRQENCFSVCFMGEISRSGLPK